MRDHNYYVYILTNKHCSTLYIGVTNDLERRIAEHKLGEVPGFTQRYQLNRLVWFEHFRDIDTAIAFEKRAQRLAAFEEGRAHREEQPSLVRSKRRLGAATQDRSRLASVEEMVSDPSPATAGSG